MNRHGERLFTTAPVYAAQNIAVNRNVHYESIFPDKPGPAKPGPPPK